MVHEYREMGMEVEIKVSANVTIVVDAKYTARMSMKMMDWYNKNVVVHGHKKYHYDHDHGCFYYDPRPRPPF